MYKVTTEGYMYTNSASVYSFSITKKLSRFIFLLLVSLNISLNVLAQTDQAIANNISAKNEEETTPSIKLQEESIYDQQTLMGSFFGIRSISAPIGIEFGGTIKNDLWKNISGGNNRQSADIVYIDFSIDVDLQEAIGLSGSSFYVHFLGNNGNSVSNSVGDFQKISNIEAYPMGKLYQIFLQQRFYDDRLSMLLGVFDLNSEFYVTQTSGLFLNSSHGIGIDVGQTGNNGPSIFPNASLAFRLSFAPAENVYSQVALFDGMPGVPDDPNKFGISISAADGYFAVAEFGIEEDDQRKIGIGVWKYSGSFSDLCSEIDPTLTIQRNDNYGGYILFDQVLLGSDKPSTNVMRGFVRFGMANGHVNSFDYQIGSGIVYCGLFPTREADQFGIAVASAHAGEDYRSLMQKTFLKSVATETSLELTYKMKAMDWLSVQTDVQYIVHPSANPLIDNAIAGGIRLEIVL